MLSDFNLAFFITKAIILLVAFPIHEFAHAWTANYFGDDTPRIFGRLTLNPIKHLDPIGSIALLLANFGWAKPVPVNPVVLQRNSRSGLMLVSLAGPMSNFLMALLASIPFLIGLITPETIQSNDTIRTVSQFIVYFIYINLLLAFFNMIPLMPLDGEKILMHFLPPSAGRAMEQIRPYQPIILLAVVFLGSRTGILYAPVNWLLGILTGLG